MGSEKLFLKVDGHLVSQMLLFILYQMGQMQSIRLACGSHLSHELHRRCCQFYCCLVFVMFENYNRTRAKTLVICLSIKYIYLFLPTTYFAFGFLSTFPLFFSYALFKLQYSLVTFHVFKHIYWHRYFTDASSISSCLNWKMLVVDGNEGLFCLTILSSLGYTWKLRSNTCICAENYRKYYVIHIVIYLFATLI